MGLPGSSNISADILPMLLINVVMSIGQIKHALHSFMQVIGLLSAAPSSGDTTSSIEFPDEYSFCSGLMLPGLSKEIQQALPLTVYNPDLHVSAPVNIDCAVCLQEFHKDQEVRLLPFCRHLFHRSCLDRWLEQEQFTCPVCRSSLVPEEVSFEDFVPSVRPLYAALMKRSDRLAKICSNRIIVVKSLFGAVSLV